MTFCGVFFCRSVSIRLQGSDRSRGRWARSPLVGFFPVIRQPKCHPLSACRILSGYPTTPAPSALRLSDSFRLSDNPSAIRDPLVGFFPVIRQPRRYVRSPCICKRATSLEAALLKNAVTIIYSCLPIGNGWSPSLAARLRLYPKMSNMGCCFRLLHGGSGIRRSRSSCLPSSY